MCRNLWQIDGLKMIWKWIEMDNLSNGQYSARKNVGFKTSVLRPNLCDYSDVYIVVKGTITVEGYDANN